MSHQSNRSTMSSQSNRARMGRRVSGAVALALVTAFGVQRARR
jgi:hypothetical protein